MSVIVQTLMQEHISNSMATADAAATGSGIVEIIRVSIAGFIQGITEFFPVSSSGHLTLLKTLFHWPTISVPVIVALHVGTTIAIIIYFWDDLSRMLKAFIKMPLDWTQSDVRWVWLIIIVSIPTFIIAGFVSLYEDTLFNSSFLVAGMLLFTSLILFLSDTVEKTNKFIVDIPLGLLVLVGIAQGFAVLPGLSRSGVTIAVLLFIGARRDESAKFAFFMAIPVILAGGLYEFVMPFLSGSETMKIASADILGVVIGTAIAAISGVFAIRLLLPLIKKAKLVYFSLYTCIIAVIVFFVEIFSAGS